MESMLYYNLIIGYVVVCLLVCATEILLYYFPKRSSSIMAVQTTIALLVRVEKMLAFVTPYTQI